MALWLSTRLLRALEIEIARGPEGPVLALDLPKLRKALQASEVPMGELEEPKKDGHATVITRGLARRPGWQAELLRWQSLLVPGGRLIVLDRGAPEEISRRLLCAGLTDIEQSMVGRRLLSCARRPA